MIEEIPDREGCPQLTEEQRAFVQKSQICPVCKAGGFLRGPRGAATIFVKCANADCAAEFELITMFEIVIRGMILPKGKHPSLARCIGIFD